MDLRPLLSPKSIAVIGASAKEGSIGHELLAMLDDGGYQGDVYPINPRYPRIRNLDCYESIADLPEPVDLAFIVLSPQRLEQQVDAALKARARSMVITPNAVAEDDAEPKLAERLRKKLRDAEIPVSGYNSMGFYNNDIKLKACGFRAPIIAGCGNIAYISQSGSVFSAITHNDPQLLFNLSINTGAELNVTVADYIQFALEQPTTRIIGIFVEAIRDPEGFKKALRRAAERRIPVVALKVGKSALGAKYTISHSGGLAGDDEAFNAVLRRHGAIRVDCMDELANTLLLFSYFPVAPKGEMALIADSGGERSMICDVAEKIDLPFAELQPKTIEQLAKVQDYGQEAANPLDPWGTGINFEHTLGTSLEIMAADPGSSIGIISLDIRDDNFMAASCVSAFKHARKTVDKPMIHMTNYTGIRRTRTTEMLNALGVPVLCATRPTLKAVKNWLDYRDFELETGNEHYRSINALEGKTQVMQEHEALDWLCGVVATANGFAINSEEELCDHHLLLKYPVVLKTMQDGVVHKTEAGGVATNIKGPDELVDAYLKMSKRCGSLAMIQQMVKVDFELMLGMKTDEIYGKLVILGAGGIFAEQMRDSVAMLPDAGNKEIEACIRRLKIFDLLQGARGKAPVDLDALVQTVADFCEMVRALGETVSEIDINPLAISESQPIALDALIVPSGYYANKRSSN